MTSCNHEHNTSEVKSYEDSDSKVRLIRRPLVAAYGRSLPGRA